MNGKARLKKWIIKFSSLLLPVSVGFIVVSLTLVLLGDLQMPRFVLAVSALIPGAILWYAGMLLKNRARFYFAATFLILTGCLLLVLDVYPYSIPLPVIWPLLMLIIALSFISSGFLRYRKVHAIYIVPAVAFSILGFIFLLFTTKVITVSFISVALWWFPLFFLPAASAFVLWLFQKSHISRDSNE